MNAWSKLPINGRTVPEIRSYGVQSRTITAFAIFEIKRYFVRKPTVNDHKNVSNQNEYEAMTIEYSLNREAEDQL